MAFASFNGAAVNSAKLCVPYYGIWCADLAFPKPDAVDLSGPLVIGDLSMQGTIVSGDSFAGSRKVQAIGGKAGWRKSIPSQNYSNPSGIKLSVVLGDAAANVGEQVRVSNDSVIGVSYVRESAPASRFLRQLAGPLWYIDSDGITQVGDRPTKAITTAFSIIKADPSNNSFQIATENYKDWLPGNTFSNVIVPMHRISMTTFILDNQGKLRLEVLAQEAA